MLLVEKTSLKDPEPVGDHSIPPLHHCALLFDIDGTLIDLVRPPTLFMCRPIFAGRCSVCMS